jgi:hypothetical protein
MDMKDEKHLFYMSLSLLTREPRDHIDLKQHFISYVGLQFSFLRLRLRLSLYKLL